MDYLSYGAMILFLFFTGACVGSFLNVVVYRVPRGQSFIFGRSQCPVCHRTLGAVELIPIVSRVVLRGACKGCKAPIAFRYSLVEVLTGLAALILVYRYQWSAESIIYFAATAGLIVIAFVDMDTMTIPNAFVAYLFLPAIFSAWLIQPPALLSRVIGAMAVSVPMYILTLLIADSFGLGDVKLMFVCGFLLGTPLTLLAGFAALLLGGTHGMILLLQNRENKKRHIAFGPHLCVGVFVAMAWGNTWIAW